MTLTRPIVSTIVCAAAAALTAAAVLPPASADSPVSTAAFAVKEVQVEVINNTPVTCGLMKTYPSGLGNLRVNTLSPNGGRASYLNPPQTGRANDPNNTGVYKITAGSASKKLADAGNAVIWDWDDLDKTSDCLPSPDGLTSFLVKVENYALGTPKCEVRVGGRSIIDQTLTEGQDTGWETVYRNIDLDVVRRSSTERLAPGWKYAQLAVQCSRGADWSAHKNFDVEFALNMVGRRPAAGSQMTQYRADASRSGKQLCITPAGNEARSGAALTLERCTGDDDQQVQATTMYAGAGPRTTIKGLCFDVPWGDIREGATLQLWECNDTAAQSIGPGWPASRTITYLGNGGHRQPDDFIFLASRTANSNLCIAAEYREGAPLRLMDCGPRGAFKGELGFTWKTPFEIDCEDAVRDSAANGAGVQSASHRGRGKGGPCLTRVETRALSADSVRITWKPVRGFTYQHRIEDSRGTVGRWRDGRKPNLTVDLAARRAVEVQVRAVKLRCGCRGPVTRVSLPSGSMID